MVSPALPVGLSEAVTRLPAIAPFAHNDAGAQASWAVRRTNGRPDHLLDSLLSSQAGDVGEPHQRLDPADGAPRSVIVSR
jgi:hypothetical protein